MITISEIPLSPGVYLFTCKVNNKIYIGESLDMKYRMSQHKCAYTDSYFHRAILKYGWENFEVEVLQEYKIPVDDTSKKEMDLRLLALETAFIDYFDSTNPIIGYNVLKFGFNRTGVACSPEAKIKHSLAVKGEKNGFFGKKHTKETRGKISQARRSRIYNPVKQIDISNNQVIKIWPSLVEASKELNISKSHIGNVCRKQKTPNGHIYQTASGFKWEYVQQQS